MSERDTSPMLPEERDRHMVLRLARLEKIRRDRERGPEWDAPCYREWALKERRVEAELYFLSVGSAEFLGDKRFRFETFRYRKVPRS